MSVSDRLRGQYPATLTIALVALIPYLLVTSASSLLEQEIATDLGAGQIALAWASSMSTAGYAFGALFAGDLVQRYQRRTLFPIFATMTLAGWLLAAFAHGPWMYGVGHVLAGTSTGMLLVVALPPVLTGFPYKVDFSAGFINLGLFGAIAAGPLVGGIVAASLGWRAFYFVLAAIAATALAFSRVVLEENDPPEPELKRDWGALVLSFFGTVLPFGAVAILGGADFGSPKFLVPLGIGLACFAAIFVYEEMQDAPLVPIHQTLHTLPIIGTLIAAFAGGVLLSITELTVARTMEIWHFSPLDTGLVFSPLLPGAGLAAMVLSKLFRSRWLPVLIAAGLVLMIASGALMVAATDARQWPLESVAAGLLGFGAGATVSPALFLAAFSLHSSLLPRVFAFIELVRSVGDFLMGPLLLQWAKTISGPARLAESGVATGLEIALGVGIGGTALCVAMFRSAYRGLPTPDVEAWLEDDDAVALPSPGIFGLPKPENES